MKARGGQLSDGGQTPGVEPRQIVIHLNGEEWSGMPPPLRHYHKYVITG